MRWRQKLGYFFDGLPTYYRVPIRKALILGGIPDYLFPSLPSTFSSRLAEKEAKRIYSLLQPSGGMFPLNTMVPENPAFVSRESIASAYALAKMNLMKRAGFEQVEIQWPTGKLSLQ